MTIDRIIDALIDREGGYSDHPDDAGGPTCWGITEAVARRSGYAGEMRDMPRSVAEAIYRRQYVTGPRFHEAAALDEAVGEELVDTGVNMGIAVAARMLQRSLTALNRRQRDYPDLQADGVIGEQTLAALATYLRLRGAEGRTVLLRALNCLQGARYIELAEAREANESFLFGWLRVRVD